MLTKERIYFTSIILMLLEFYITCFFGTSDTVSYNVTTLVYGDTNIDVYTRYFFQLSITLIFLYVIKEYSVKITYSFLLILGFIIWISIVPLVVKDNFLTNIKYVFYLIVIIIGFNLFQGKKSFVDFNIKMLSLMGISILLFSVIYIIQFPIPEYREYRASIMHSNANEDALILAVSFPFYFLFRNKSIKYILILYYIFFLVFYNSTRGAIAMSIVTALIMLYEKYKRYKILMIIIFSSGLLLSSSILNKYVFDDPFFEQGYSAIKEQEQGNFSGRVYGIWIPVVTYTLEHSPIFGFGAKKYGELADEITFTTNEKGGLIYTGRSPHNFFIMFLFNWGLVGLFFLILIYYKYILMAYKSYMTDKNIINLAVFSSWVSFTGMNFISNSFSYRGWSIFVILVLTTHFLKGYKINGYKYG